MHSRTICVSGVPLFHLVEIKMIRGVHVLFYTPKAVELRLFIRDKLGLPYKDTGEGWLIFDLPEADLGCHPSDVTTQSISFYCDHITKTVEEMKSRGIEFTSGITDQGWGKLTHFRMPGDIEVELYEPKYKKRVLKSQKAKTVLIGKVKRPKTE
jgi:hypothetical protein